MGARLPEWGAQDRGTERDQIVAALVEHWGSDSPLNPWIQNTDESIKDDEEPAKGLRAPSAPLFV